MVPGVLMLITKHFKYGSWCTDVDNTVKGEVTPNSQQFMWRNMCCK